MGQDGLSDFFSRPNRLAVRDEPPMAYLIRWRLQLAARALGSTSRGVADIAEEVGYESEAAFNRAFKREFGSPPARYRREQRATRVYCFSSDSSFSERE